MWPYRKVTDTSRIQREHVRVACHPPHRMTTTGHLYLWANGLQGATCFDHTWVTTYPFTNGEYPSIDNIPDGGAYWYSWGIYHASGDGGVHHQPNGAIGDGSADLEIARKIVEANTAPPEPPIGSPSDPQDGSITFYSVDGVCHNVANQVLVATGSKTQEPLRVTEARGYHLSSFFYTNYGLNDAGWKALRLANAPDVEVPPDDFNAWFESTLGRNVSFKQVLGVAAARAAAQVALQRLHLVVAGMSRDEVYAAVAAINLTALAAVGKILGLEDFLALFPSLSVIPTNLQEMGSWIDKDMLHRSLKLMQARLLPA